jgi:hypothetical protein
MLTCDGATMDGYAGAVGDGDRWAVAVEARSSECLADTRSALLEGTADT